MLFLQIIAHSPSHTHRKNKELKRSKQASCRSTWTLKCMLTHTHTQTHTHTLLVKWLKKEVNLLFIIKDNDKQWNPNKQYMKCLTRKVLNMLYPLLLKTQTYTKQKQMLLTNQTRTNSQSAFLLSKWKQPQEWKGCSRLLPLRPKMISNTSNFFSFPSKAYHHSSQI